MGSSEIRFSKFNSHSVANSCRICLPERMIRSTTEIYALHAFYTARNNFPSMII